MVYSTPKIVIVNLLQEEESIAMARCNGGAWNRGGCS